MAQPYFLAIDAGTTCLKAVVMDAGGQIAAAEEVEMAGCYVAPCRLDMEALLQALAGALARLRPRCPQPWDALAGVGVTGQGDGLFPLDKNGRPFMPAITWQDGNAAPEAERLAGLTRTLGNQRCNLPFPGSRMAILRRLKDHAPEEYRNIGYALGCVSFLVYCLTGQSVTDLSNCGEGVDLAKGSYAADIYQAFGLADMLDKLPSLRPSWAVAGPVSPQAASLFGLPAGLPVGVGALDTTAAAFGAGEQWDASIIAGTTLAVSLCLGAPQPVPTEKGFVDLLPFDPPVMRLTLGTAAGACALDFVRERFFSGMDYGGFFALAAQSSPGANGVLFLPFINGERAPFSCPQATGAFLGLRNSTGPADLARAYVEGIAYSARHCLAAMRSTPPRQALLSGGASKSAVFCQIFADALGIPLGLAPAYVNPDCEVLVSIAGTTEDVAMVKETAKNLFENGYDVIAPNADQASLGVMEAANEVEGAMAIANGDGMITVAPSNTVTAVIMNTAVGYYAAFEQFRTNSIPEEVKKYGIADNLIEMPEWNPDFFAPLTEEQIAKVQGAYDALANGEVTINLD